MGRLESESLVETVRLGPRVVRGELDPVTPQLPGALHRGAHQDPADAVPPLIGVDVHRLQLGTQAAPVLQVAEHDELADPDELALYFRHQDGALPLGDLGQGALIRRQVGRILPPLDQRPVDQELDNARDVLLGRLTDHRTSVRVGRTPSGSLRRAHRDPGVRSMSASGGRARAAFVGPRGASVFMRPIVAHAAGTLRVVRTQMTALRFSFDPIRSCVWVDARSSLLPIKTQTRGLRGWVDVALLSGGGVDLDLPVQGRLEISVDRLSSGNHLYDRELKRRIDARTHPLIIGQITGVRSTEVDGRYRVTGDLAFHGETRVFEHEMTITVSGESTIELKGDRVFDIREFGMKPPSMLMLKVYPEVAVRIELYGSREP
jgi:hypothetical protein